MDAPLQLDFLLGLFRPLLTLPEASFLLDGASQDHITRLVDEGQLRAVNIACDLETRRELRIYRYTAERLMIGDGRARFRDVRVVPVEAIIGSTRPNLLKREVASILACTEQHIVNLRLPGPNLGRLTGRTVPRYSREALVTFLNDREVRP